MRPIYIWVRVGDRDDYNNFDSIGDATEYLHDRVCFGDDCNGHQVDRHESPMLAGLNVDHFIDQNGVSFYWGDNDAKYSMDISDLELEAVRLLISD